MIALETRFALLLRRATLGLTTWALAAGSVYAQQITLPAVDPPTVEAPKPVVTVSPSIVSHQPQRPFSQLDLPPVTHQVTEAGCIDVRERFPSVVFLEAKCLVGGIDVFR